MITEMRHAVVRFQPGTVVSSTKQLCILGPELWKRAYLGTDLRIPEKMFKIFITERYGDMAIEHVAIQFSDKAHASLIVIYAKIYEGTKCYLLQNLRGIHEVVSQCNTTDVTSQFIRFNTLNDLNAVTQGGYCYSYYTDTLSCYRDYPSYDQILNTEDYVPISENDFSMARLAFGFTDAQLVDCGTDVENVENVAFKITTPIDDCDGYPCESLGCLESALAPTLGVQYSGMAYDPMTLRSVREVELDRKVLCKGLYYPSSISQKEIHTFAVPERLSADTIVLKEYDQFWLAVCHRINMIPLTEIAFEGVRTEKNYEIIITNAVSKTIEYDKKSIRRQVWELVSLLCSESSVLKCTVVKNYVDECFIELNYGSYTRRIYVDLSIAVLLSRNIIRTV